MAQSGVCGVFCSKKGIEVDEDDFYYGREVPEMVAARRAPKPVAVIHPDLISLHMADNVSLGGGDSPRLMDIAHKESDEPTPKIKAKSPIRQFFRRVFLPSQQKQIQKEVDSTSVVQIEKTVEEGELEFELPFGAMLMDLSLDDFLKYSAKYKKGDGFDLKETNEIKPGSNLPFGMMLMDLSVEEFLRYSPTYHKHVPLIVVTPPADD